MDYRPVFFTWKRFWCALPSFSIYFNHPVSCIETFLSKVQIDIEFCIAVFTLENFCSFLNIYLEHII